MKVDLQSRNFEAFLMTAKTLHFAKAAELLYISASALSQRISALEFQLQSKLFKRNSSEVSITDTGLRLLRYCQEVKALQEEMLRDVGGNQKLGGTVMLAAFSSVSRSFLMPALRDLQHQNSELDVHFCVAHLQDMHEMLTRGKVDFIVVQDLIAKAGYQHILLGYEHNVLVESVSAPGNADIFLDHNQADDFTERFLLRFDGVLGKPLRRRFCDDIYGILDGVRLGLGRGVVPRHLITPEMGLRIVAEYDQDWVTPVFLQFPHKDYYSAPIRSVRDTLLARAPEFLNLNLCGW